MPLGITMKSLVLCSSLSQSDQKLELSDWTISDKAEIEAKAKHKTDSETLIYSVFHM